jgi:hypothetical protein
LKRSLLSSLGEEATMFRIVGYRPWPPPERFKANTFLRLRPLHLTEIEQDEERFLEAMLHWHDPEERLRTLRHRCHTHTLVDDNPASG